MQWYRWYSGRNSAIVWPLFILFMSNWYWLASSQDGKIVGGKLAKQGEFPYTLCLRGGVRCGATLVAWDKFLTAGSCFYNAPNISYIAMFGGRVDFRDKEAQEIYVLDYKRHKKFENRTIGTGFYVLHDIAVGTLESPYKETDTLKVAVFPANTADGMKKFVEDFKKTKKICLATGYGADDDQNPEDSVSFKLKVLEVQLQPDKECGILPELVSMELCGSAVKQPDHTYVGDTGATLVCDGKVIGMTKSFQKVERDGKTLYFTTFLLFGPYMQDLNLWNGAVNRIFHLHPLMFLSPLLSLLYRLR